MIRAFVLTLAFLTVGCSNSSVPSNRDILEGIHSAMNETDRTLFEVTRMERLNGFTAENNAYRVECQYDLKLIQTPPQNTGEKLNEEFNKLSDQQKMSVSQNPAYRIALWGTQDEHSLRRKVASWGYRNVGDFVTFKGFFDFIRSEQGWILNPSSRGSLSISTP
jgi:hypothetical protein